MKRLAASILAICIPTLTAIAYDLSGEYDCSGFDSHAGYMAPDRVTVTRDDKASVPGRDFSAYQFTSKAYNGYLAQQGDVYAVRFENHDKKDPDASSDYGVGLFTVSFDADKKGKYNTVLRGPYYQPEYKRDAGGGNGYCVCYKVGS